MSKIKISVYAFLVSSLLLLPTLACASSAALGDGDGGVARQSNGESSGLTAEPKTPAAAQKDAAAIKFKGAVGTAEFEMTVRCAGDDLSGSYFYAKSGKTNALALAGKIEADGKFTLRETDASGRQTGEFKGVWKDEADESSVSIEGEWTKASDEKVVTFFASEQVISFAGGARIIDKEFSSPVKAIRLDADAEYPELTGGGANAAGFNRTVKARAEKVVADFKKLMIKATTAEDLKHLPKDVGYYLDLGYSVQYADDDVISLLFSEDTYSGGAHPNHNFFALDYDLKNGRELKLAELFKLGAKYLETLSAYSTKDLQSRKSPETGENAGLAQDIWLEGAKPTADNFKSGILPEKA